MMLQKQEYFCPNCGCRMTDIINTDHVPSLLCSAFCREEWQMKYACMILGKAYAVKQPMFDLCPHCGVPAKQCDCMPEQ